MIQCCDSLFWALLRSSQAGGVIVACLSPEMPSNLENYQLIVDYCFNHITSAWEWRSVMGLLPASPPDVSRCLLCLLVAQALNSW